MKATTNKCSFTPQLVLNSRQNLPLLFKKKEFLVLARVTFGQRMVIIFYSTKIGKSIDKIKFLFF